MLARLQWAYKNTHHTPIFTPQQLMSDILVTVVIQDQQGNETIQGVNLGVNSEIELMVHHLTKGYDLDVEIMLHCSISIRSTNLQAGYYLYERRPDTPVDIEPNLAQPVIHNTFYTLYHPSSSNRDPASRLVWPLRVPAYLQKKRCPCCPCCVLI